MESISHTYTFLPPAHTRPEQRPDPPPKRPSGTQMRYPKLGSSASFQPCSPYHFHCPANGTAFYLVPQAPICHHVYLFPLFHKSPPPPTNAIKSFFILCPKFLLLHPLHPYLGLSSHPWTTATAIHPVSLPQLPLLSPILHAALEGSFTKQSRPGLCSLKNPQ